MITKKCNYPNCNKEAVEGHDYCEEHLQQSQKNRKAFQNAKRANEDFYKSTAWRVLRTAIIKQHPYCSYCGTDANLTVDHITPPRGNEELFYDADNLQVLCKECHRMKTVKEIYERKNNTNN